MDDTKHHKYEDEAYRTVARIRELRQARGWTVQELAYRAEMERSSVSRIENGRHNITIDTLYRLADALGVSPRELLPR